MPVSRWPPTTEWVSGLLSSPESRLTEFKREWYNLEEVGGKAELTKDVVALANSVEPDEMAIIVVGIDDPTRGGAVLGVTLHPPADRVSQIIAAYSEPVPQIEYAPVAYKEKSIGVVGIFPSPHRPHYVTRDVHGVLSRAHVYIRRGPTVGIATWTEIEVLIRAKEARLDAVTSIEPIQAGFVEIDPGRGGDVVVRVTNIRAQPVTGVDILLDAVMPALPGAVNRAFRFAGRKLEPGESLEARFKVQAEDFFLGKEPLGLEWRGCAVTRIMDLILTVQYRDNDGLIRQLQRRAALIG
jgi:schlafen family protein